MQLALLLPGPGLLVLVRNGATTWPGPQRSTAAHVATMSAVVAAFFAVQLQSRAARWGPWKGDTQKGALSTTNPWLLWLLWLFPTHVNGTRCVCPLPCYGLIGKGALDGEELFTIEGSENWRSTPDNLEEREKCWETSKKPFTAASPPYPATKLKAAQFHCAYPSLLRTGMSASRR